MTTSFLTHPVRSRVTLLIGLLFLTFSSVVAQNTEYVGETVLTNAGTLTKNYHFTKSVTLRATGAGSTILSSAGGNLEIKSISVNPPPSPEQNYVRTEVPREEVTNEEALTLMDGSEKVVSYNYVDGLGRSLMTSVAEAGPLYEDYVQHSEYDAATAREVESYLPYAQAYNKPGSFIANAKDATTGFYSSPPTAVVEDDKPYSYREFDARGRVTAVVSAGENWHTADPSSAKKMKYDYFMHDPSETDPSIDFPVARWDIVNDYPVHSNYYIAEELSVATVENPQGQKSRVVQDARGLTIASQMYDADSLKWIGSYNVYDDMGRVRFIIPPLITDQLNGLDTLIVTQDQFDELLFEYKYDDRGRVIEARKPGAGWEYFVYDTWNRLVMTRHDDQKWEDVTSWTFYKYDALNRPIMSGEVKSPNNRSSMQNLVDGKARYETTANDQYGYTLFSSFPRLPTDFPNYEIRTLNYYDNYNFKTYASWGSGNYDLSLPAGFTGTELTNTLNKPTGSKVRVLDSDPAQWLRTVTYYDDEHTVLQVVAENHLQGIDRITNQREWNGELQKSLLAHQSSTASVDILKEYEYLHNGQLDKLYHTIDERERVLLADYNYNRLGQLIEKNLHSLNGTSFLQSVDYRTNIQGSLSSINSLNLNEEQENDLFGMQYAYETSVVIDGQNTEERFDGLVNATKWNATNTTPSVNPTNGPKGNVQTVVGYTYDGQNRLAATKYAEASGANFDEKVGYFDIEAVYDNNGNIDSLSRKADNAVLDELAYDYEASSNKLQNVRDLSTNTEGFNDYYPGQTDYKYTAMGNLKEDMNKQITLIRYNHLQLVDSITFYDHTSIDYVYDAVGNKLAKLVIDSAGNVRSRIDYLGSIEYLNGEINQIYTEEGRAYAQTSDANGQLFHYEYFITDHQGNNRVAFGELPERHIYTATMETSDPKVETYETNEFTFPVNTVRTNSHNHTPLGAESIVLNGSVTGGHLGPAKVLAIAANDEVDIEAWVHYEVDFSNDRVTNFLSLISSLFGTASAGTGAEGASSALTNAFGNPTANNIFDGNGSSNAPEAYLQWLFFDASYNFVPGLSSFSGVGTDAKDEFVKLSSGKLTFQQAGYLFIYVANESTQNQDVYFDDIKITHASSATSFRVTQVNDYYPFGLPTSNSWRAKGYIDPGLLYQSSFSTLDSLTGFYDFLSRSYDPVIGRFFAVDPAGQFHSPYNGMGNVPHQMIDPTGELGWLADIGINLLGSLARTAVQSLVNSWNGSGSFEDNFAALGVNTGATYSPGSGWEYNAANGYGGLTAPQGGSSSVFGGFKQQEDLVSDFTFGTSISNVGIGFNSELGALEYQADTSPKKWKIVNGEVQSAGGGTISSSPSPGGVAVGFGGTIAIIGGITFEIGRIEGSNGKWAPYLSLGSAYGYDISAGFEMKNIANNDNSPFTIREYEGFSISDNVGVGFVDHISGGNPNPNKFWNIFDYGYSYTEHGFGISASPPIVPVAYTRQYVYTWVFD